MNPAGATTGMRPETTSSSLMIPLTPPTWSMLDVEREGGRGRLARDQRVDDDDPGVAFDEADDREVVAANLIDARHHLVQSVLDEELALAPQARVHRVGCLAFEEFVRVEVPHDSTIGRVDLSLRGAADESSTHVIEVTRVVHRQRGSRVVERSSGGVSCLGVVGHDHHYARYDARSPWCGGRTPPGQMNSS